MVTKPPVIRLISASSLEELEKNINTLFTSLTREFWQEHWFKDVQFLERKNQITAVITFPRRKDHYTSSYSDPISPLETLQSQLPHCIKSERSVLSALLLDELNFPLVSDVLKPDDFFDDRHAIIYNAIINVFNKHKKTDLLLIQDELIALNQLEAVGGIEYIMELQENIPMIGTIVRDASIIKDNSILRSIIKSCAHIIDKCYDDPNAIYTIDQSIRESFPEISSKSFKEKQILLFYLAVQNVQFEYSKNSEEAFKALMLGLVSPEDWMRLTNYLAQLGERLENDLKTYQN